ncbi:CRISPR-associated endonuclease Cas1 [Candidatus Roizmanbacteria bacterium CG10_big_fil_rev_8_21_14_0_10_39_6]|uniref:CRISPR-associated endonuclease Cas1 n=1 Tax=Candidatus Roizmanbacteria bacterium CG10_big_fil_rev_8_21_14_0_10_39_6 TaxID=1974853 RepID=A0A2M8KRR4_9BACT|nr:MAG: CRISPR-associated endonuclease Cas1 [Candidatus Roizmanbacteria bacterium CG10_big_fil_rev_8_21_14_0_10_39_6]
MLTLPDFKEKRIVFMYAEYGQKNLLQLTNDTICFVRNNETINKISCHIVFAVFVVGDISITTSLLKKLNNYGISIFFLNHNLAVKASFVAEAEGNYLLREKQYKTDNALTIAKNIVDNKIFTQEWVLKKYEKPYNAKVFNTARVKLKSVKDREQLLGIEGYASREYFQSLFSTLSWVRRAPQTKEDVNNMLLDIGYTYLFNYCDSLLRLFGFDTYKGYYHQLFFQRKSLVCDVMEPIRPLIDYQLLKSFNLKQINQKDFIFRNGRFDFKDGYKTSKLYSALFLEAINNKKEDIYAYILNFYRYSMDDTKYPFKKFTL